jgi:hypothetical protein
LLILHNVLRYRGRPYIAAEYGIQAQCDRPWFDIGVHIRRGSIDERSYSLSIDLQDEHVPHSEGRIGGQLEPWIKDVPRPKTEDIIERVCDGLEVATPERGIPPIDYGTDRVEDLLARNEANAAGRIPESLVIQRRSTS